MATHGLNGAAVGFVSPLHLIQRNLAPAVDHFRHLRGAPDALVERGLEVVGALIVVFVHEPTLQQTEAALTQR